MIRKSTLLFISFIAFSSAFSQWTIKTVPTPRDESFTALYAHSAQVWLAAGLNASISMSADYCASWTIADSGSPLGMNWEQMDFADVDGYYGFIVGSYSGLAKTTDAGMSWTRISFDSLPQEVHGIKCVSMNNVFVVGSNGTLLQSTDTGKVWGRIGTPVNSVLQKIDFFNATDGIIVGDYGVVLTTTDGGAHWTEVTTDFDEDINHLQILNATTCIITHDDEIYRSTDKGLTWNKCSINATTSFYSLSFPTANVGYVTAGTKLYKSINGGLNWSLQKDFGAFNQLLSVCFYDEKIGLVGTQYSKLFMTTNGGGTLNAIEEVEAYEYSISPNPAASEIAIKVTGFEPRVMCIYNVNGEKIVEGKYSPKVDITSLSAGLYFIEVKNDLNTLRKKFVKP